MKISSASIRLVMKKNRQMKDGSFPIYIVICFNGRLEKATGVSCMERNWDSKREVIKSSEKNAPVLNKLLHDIKSRIIERKNDFEYNGKSYTPAMLMSDDIKKDYSGKSNVFSSLMESLVNERRLRYGTLRTYQYCYRKLCEFIGRDEFLIDELNVGIVKDFANWLERNNIKANTIKRCMGNIASVWNYAIQKKIVTGDDYPFREFKYSMKYKEINRDYYLEKSHIVRLRDYWLDMVIERNGELWHYKDGAYERLRQRYTPEWGILWFLLCYKYNGSSPADVALLRPEQVKRTYIGGVDYFAIETRRIKTGRNVHIRLKKDLLTIIGLEHFLGVSGHFIYPVMNWYDGCSDRYLLEQSHKASDKAIKWVREAFRAINEQIVLDNVKTGSNEPIVDVDRVVMYVARHSKASNYFNTPGATIAGLASMLSRSANTIATYAHMLRKDEELAEFDELSPI